MLVERGIIDDQHAVAGVEQRSDVVPKRPRIAGSSRVTSRVKASWAGACGRTTALRPKGRPKTWLAYADTLTALVAAIRADGLVVSQQLTGAIHRPTFLEFLTTVLGPTLQRGDVVVMDNLSVHKGPAVRDALAAFGATVLFLPAYSPDFNPIERMFSKVKAKLRALAAHMVETPTAAVETALATVTPSDCIGWFTACGDTIPPVQLRITH